MRLRKASSPTYSFRVSIRIYLFLLTKTLNSIAERTDVFVRNCKEKIFNQMLFMLIVCIYYCARHTAHGASSHGGVFAEAISLLLFILPSFTFYPLPITLYPLPFTCYLLSLFFTPAAFSLCHCDASSPKQSPYFSHFFYPLLPFTLYLSPVTFCHFFPPPPPM